jgi:mannose-6-phosphate isomerase-like protein (cupin superfamily)
MVLRKNELLPAEVHPDNDQIFICKSGEGVVMLGPERAQVNVSFTPGRMVMVDAGMRHAVQALEIGLEMWAIYAPWHHPPGTVHKTNPELSRAPAPVFISSQQQQQYGRRN